MNLEDLKALSKEDIPQKAGTLNASDVDFLVETLSEKADETRYTAFLLLQANGRKQPYIYEHWATLEAKLDSDNSYQRSLGSMLLAQSVKWDKKGKFKKCLDKYMVCCADEKFITARQAIQGLLHVAEATDKYDAQIRQALGKLPLEKYKENQQHLLKKDIAATLKAVENKHK